MQDDVAPSNPSTIADEEARIRELETQIKLLKEKAKFFSNFTSPNTHIRLTEALNGSVE